LQGITEYPCTKGAGILLCYLHNCQARDIHAGGLSLSLQNQGFQNVMVQKSLANMEGLLGHPLPKLSPFKASVIKCFVN
jgi:hypothetical protein